ncbi:carbohydrate ABC transporter permease [Paenibacillus sp. P25]|nr:carbohydrate ABC transporter permease [Paenibacillus sp. P25]
MESMTGTFQQMKTAVKKRRSPGSQLLVAIVAVFLFAYFLIVAYPLFWMAINSLKVTDEIYSSNWALPSKWMFSNYAEAWDKGVSDYFFNSLWITAVTIVLTVLTGAFSAYGLSRFQFRGKYAILALLSAGMMFSPQVSLIPLFKLVQTLHIYNTGWALILPYVAFRTSLTVLLIRSFFLSLPKELEESAFLDGCSSLGIFFRIFLPLSKPIMMTTVILTAYWAWNEFMFAIIFIDSDSEKTITAGLLAFRDALYTDWGVLMAGLIISALPLILLFIFMQKHFIRGLSEGGVKG